MTRLSGLSVEERPLWPAGPFRGLPQQAVFPEPLGGCVSHGGPGPGTAGNGDGAARTPQRDLNTPCCPGVSRVPHRAGLPTRGQAAESGGLTVPVGVSEREARFPQVAP